MQFTTEINHEHTYQFCMKHFCMLKTVSMMTVRNFEVRPVYENFNVVGIYNSGSYAQKLNN